MKPIFSIVFLLLSSWAMAQAPLVITNTNVIDVRTGKLKVNTTLIIKGHTIQEVSSKKIAIPSGSTVIDGSGKYVMPGMTDGHIHFFQSGGLYTRPDALNLTFKVPYAQERQFTFNNTTDYFNRYLRLGITTVADVGGPFSNFVIRDSIRKVNIGPDVLVTGPLFSMVEDKPLDNGDAPIIKIATIQQADSLLDKMLPLKPDFIKIWYIVRPDLPADKTYPVVQHIAMRTHKANLKLAVHATQLNTASLALDAGADILVHSVEDTVVPQEFIKKLLDKKVTYIPTLTVGHGYYKTFAGKLNHHIQDLYWANPFAYGSLSDPEAMAEDKLPPALKYFRTNGIPAKVAKEDSIMAINLVKLIRAGVNVVTGTDAGNIGTMHAASYLQEQQAMKKAGLTNAEILKASTINAAIAFGRNSGAVEKGKQADLLLLSKNPLDALENIDALEFLVLGGQLLKADTLIHESPEMVVQRQVNAYNARNLEAFLDTYAEDVELYNFPDSLTTRGKEKMRKMYTFFDKVPNLHCNIVKRIVIGDKVIDHESVRFKKRLSNAVAIYEVKNGKIKKVTFIH